MRCTSLETGDLEAQASLCNMKRALFQIFWLRWMKYFLYALLLRVPPPGMVSLSLEPHLAPSLNLAESDVTGWVDPSWKKLKSLLPWNQTLGYGRTQALAFVFSSIWSRILWKCPKSHSESISFTTGWQLYHVSEIRDKDIQKWHVTACLIFIYFKTEIIKQTNGECRRG